MSIIRLGIHIEDPSSVAVVFDSIQVWRSIDGVNGTYVQMTADEEERPYVDGTTNGPWALNGRTLQVTFDNSETVTSFQFTGTDPIDLATVIATINDVLADVASEVLDEDGDGTGRLKISSPTGGTSASVDISSNSTASLLGLDGTKVNGKAGRPLIGVTTEEYSFFDYDGAEEYWYKTRYYNSRTGAASEYSDPMRGLPEEVLPSSAFRECFVYLADATGAPLVGRRVILVPTGQALVENENDETYAILTSVDRITLTTNDAGFASTELVIGQRFKIFVEGTTFHREVTIPMGNTGLNLMTAAAAADDPFTIVTTPPTLIRMT